MTEGRKTAREPMLRLNGSGYGIEWTKIVQLLVLIGGMVWVFAAASERLDVLETKLSVAPKEVLAEVRVLRDAVTQQFLEIRRTVETTRVERRLEIKELEARASDSEADRAQLNAQVKNLAKIVEDTHELLKNQYGGGR